MRRFQFYKDGQMIYCIIHNFPARHGALHTSNACITFVYDAKVCMISTQHKVSVIYRVNMCNIF